MEWISAKDPKVAHILRKCNYRKHKALVHEAEAGKPETLHRYWDGGSRSDFIAFDVNGNTYSPPSWGGNFTGAPTEWVPAPGEVLVKVGVSAGKPATAVITFYR